LESREWEKKCAFGRINGLCLLLHTRCSPPPPPPPSILHPDAMVDQLIDVGTKWWDKNLKKQILSKEEVCSILSISISLMNHEDALICRETKRGVFSVRSTYHMLKEMEETDKAEGPSRVRHSNIWRKIWQLNISNVEKHFIW
jgi:hypothetical protein